jgi:ribosomal protein S18 acetylase RimI-like enzyme
VKGGEIVGYIIYWIEDSNDLEYKAEHRRFGYVKDIYIAPEAQGLGAGTQLMEKALEHFRSRNVKLAQLHVVPRNVEAQGFYKELGFKMGALQMLKEID